MFWLTLVATCTACLQSELRFGAKEKLGHYAWVCCDNDVYTEPKGSFQATDIFQTVSNDTIFYDSQCGIPLFQLGQRDLVNWTASAIAHGWPSFRESEVYSFDNVQVTEAGEVVSKCGTHLGHRIPAALDRYIINMLCMSGYEGRTGVAADVMKKAASLKVVDPDRGAAVSSVHQLTLAAALVYLLF
jgi:peptide methionine sulfoxide reductase MsrB